MNERKNVVTLSKGEPVKKEYWSQEKAHILEILLNHIWNPILIIMIYRYRGVKPRTFFI